jgi:hypothetical protein
MIAHIDEYGWLVPEAESTYKVTLDGSFEWCFWRRMWRYKISKIEPPLPLSYLTSETQLYEHENRN